MKECERELDDPTQHEKLPLDEGLDAAKEFQEKVSSFSKSLASINARRRVLGLKPVEFAPISAAMASLRASMPVYAVYEMLSVFEDDMGRVLFKSMDTDELEAGVRWFQCCECSCTALCVRMFRHPIWVAEYRRRREMFMHPLCV